MKDTVNTVDDDTVVAQLSGVFKRFGKQEVLNGVDLTIEKGRITGLLGPSGSGKTSIVNMLVGTYLPTKGEVTVLGEKSPFRHIRLQVGYMPQSEALYNDLTAHENLRFFGTLYGLSGRALDEKVTQLLTLVRLSDQGRKLVSKYSGGMKRRLSLAIALLHDPALLILDEPTVGLDPKQRIELWRAFRDRADAGTSLLITTHVMDEASSCDRIVMIQDGRVIADGSPDELIAQTQAATLESAFLAFEQKATAGSPEPPESPESSESPGSSTSSLEKGGDDA